MFLHTNFELFSEDMWGRFSQLSRVLALFDKCTSMVSKKGVAIHRGVQLYYKVHDLLYDAIERKGPFVDLDEDISDAVRIGLSKYEKYYHIFDGSDVLYTAAILDYRVKTSVLRENLPENRAQDLITCLRSKLEKHYASVRSSEDVAAESRSKKELDDDDDDDFDRLFGDQEEKDDSEFSAYFDTPPFIKGEGHGAQRLLSWWRNWRSSYPRLAAAARDFLAIPVSEVSVERMFSRGSDVQGVRRHHLNAESYQIYLGVDREEVRST